MRQDTHFKIATAIALTVMGFAIATATTAPAAAPATTTTTTTTTIPVVTTTTAAPTTTVAAATTTTTIKAGPCGEYYQTAMNAGWEDTQWERLGDLCMRESSGDPSAFNEDDPNGGSVGLWQINLIHLRWLEPKGITREMLFDPYWNAVAARGVFERALAGSGCGWRPWGYRCV